MINRQASLEIQILKHSLYLLILLVVFNFWLLVQDSSWVYVQPAPGCAIVNLGDAMVE